MDLTPEEHKKLLKEAFKEWLNEKAADFGWWTLKFIGTACAGAVLYFLVQHGWIK